MKKSILLLLCLFFYFAQANSQTITGSPSVCVGGISMLSCSPGGGTWTSSAVSVATVNSAGIVTGVSGGTAIISYGYPVPLDTMVVTVTATAGAITGASSSCVGASTTLSCAVSGGTWSSSNPAVASVGTSGVVAGLVAGTATITYMPPWGVCPSTTVYAATTCCSGTPAPGVVVPNVTAGCASTPISLNDTGATPGVSFQWQKSPDSLAWTTISGATSSFYGFTGLTAPTYYRAKATCGFSGLSSFSPGTKINSFVCCGGGLVAGTVSASTSYCSACSLSLHLSGATVNPDVVYQWQYASYTAGPWSNLAGATDTNYTFTPSGAYYYRCRVTCTTGSASVTPTPVFVGYEYHITSHSVSAPSAVCLSTFSTVVNGLSPLLHVKTFYGDGTKDSATYTASGITSTSSSAHGYAYSGNYLVKNVLYYNNIPQDSTVSAHGYNCKTFPIKLYFDSDGDCIKDASEVSNFTPLMIRVDSGSVPVDTLSAVGGVYYKPNGPVGTIYSFRLLSSPIVASCPASGVILDTVQGTTAISPVKYFGLSCGATGVDLVVNTVLSGKTGRHRQQGHIYVRNNYCTPANATLRLDYSPRYNLGGFDYTTLPTSAFGNSIIWNVAGLSSLAAQQDLFYRVEGSPWLIPGDTVNQHIVVSPTSGVDLDNTSNTVIRNDTVKVSWDPNFVEVTPEGCFDTDDLHLQYTVHFENTGNDTAHNIYVLDTLSDYLDAKTLEIVMSSHAMDVGIYKDGPYTVAKFDFANIKLLDSSHHGLCDGAVMYTINAKPGIPLGASIKARAGIYFDINEVVMTNTAEKQKGCPVPAGVAEQSASKPKLYPNPVTDELVVRVENGMYSTFTITNSIGQEIVRQQINGVQTTVNVKALPAGMYYVVFAGDKGRAMAKFVKE
jgi:hypothetical protein